MQRPPDGESRDGVIMELSNAERETHINQCADDRSMWECYTDDPVWIARLEKIGIKPDKAIGAGFRYTIPDNQITVRRAKKPMTEAQRVKLAKRLNDARNADNTGRKSAKVGIV